MEFIKFVIELFVVSVGWLIENKETVAAFLGSAVVVSAVQQFIKRWMSSKKVIHTSLLILSALISVGDLSVMYGNIVIPHLVGFWLGLFTTALTFYRFGGKTLLVNASQFFNDAKVGRSIRQPEVDEIAHPALPLQEEFGIPL